MAQASLKTPPQHPRAASASFSRSPGLVLQAHTLKVMLEYAPRPSLSAHDADMALLDALERWLEKARKGGAC